MGFLDWFKLKDKKHSEKDSSYLAPGIKMKITMPKDTTTSSSNKEFKSWKEASSSSGYGLQVPTPHMPKGMKLCTHLSVSEVTRQNLQRFLVDHWTARPESLVAEFLEIASSGDKDPIFPNEIVDIVKSNYKREPKPESVRKKIASTYIRHEMNCWLRKADLEKYNEQGYRFASIRSAKDERVCEVCKSHDDILYEIDEIPQLPLCWECRCYYSPVVNVDFLQFPLMIYQNETVVKMTENEFKKFYKHLIKTKNTKY